MTTFIASATVCCSAGDPKVVLEGKTGANCGYLIKQETHIDPNRGHKAVMLCIIIKDAGELILSQYTASSDNKKEDTSKLDNEETTLGQRLVHIVHTLYLPKRYWHS